MKKKKHIAICIRNEQDWFSHEMKKAAKKKGVMLSCIHIQTLSDSEALLRKDVDAVIWRTSSIGERGINTIIMNSIADKKPLINNISRKTPYIGNKLFQQQLVSGIPNIESIPSYNVSSKKELRQTIKEKKLLFPFIMKKMIGAHGTDVHLIHTLSDLKKINTQNIDEYLFQNYIHNTGDYRVLVLGGVAIAAMKRHAKEGDFRNNLSQGGNATSVTDIALRKELSRIATTVATTAGLQFCGIDIIFDEKKKKFFFLEINTIPGFKGLQSVTPQCIAEELIEYSISLIDRQKKQTPQLVRSYYNTFIDYIPEKRFHFASRHFLWFGDAANKRRLLQEKNAYIGETVADTTALFTKLFAKKKIFDPFHKKDIAKKRNPFERKYPLVNKLNPIFSRIHFANTLYKENLAHILSSICDSKTILKTIHLLEKDKRALQILSTKAINFFYFAETYFSLIPDAPSYQVDPTFLLAVGRSMSYKDAADRKLLQYYYTHCIIGASKFYSKRIQKHRAIYKDMLKETEYLIQNYYWETSLDNKLEFLVCAQLLDYPSKLTTLIQNEAAQSLSPLGNFIVNTHNAHCSPFLASPPLLEHTNVLYLMSQKIPGYYSLK